MFLAPQPAAAAVRGGPTPLLTHLAGEFAPALAACWPAPHGEFLTAPASRRHLSCLALATRARVSPEACLHQRVRLVIGEAFPETHGLARALERLGELAWNGDDYRLLLAQLRRREAAKVLQHVAAITPGLLHGLAGLPEAFHRTKLVALMTQDRVRFIMACLDSLSRRHGEVAVQEAARVWAGAETLGGLAEAIQRDLPDDPIDPQLPESPRLRRLATKDDIRQAAAKYRNCLAGHFVPGLGEDSAYYEWMGEPGAVLELVHDRRFGWSLKEANLAGNEAIVEPLRSEIIAELGRVGAYVGPSVCDLYSTARDLADEPFCFTPLNNLFGW